MSVSNALWITTSPKTVFTFAPSSRGGDRLTAGTRDRLKGQRHSPAVPSRRAAGRGDGAPCGTRPGIYKCPELSGLMRVPRRAHLLCSHSRLRPQRCTDKEHCWPGACYALHGRRPGAPWATPPLIPVKDECCAARLRLFRGD